MNPHAAFIPTILSTRPLTLSTLTTTAPTFPNLYTPSPHHIPSPHPLRRAHLFSPSPSSPPLSTPPTRILVWHHTDLRLADNPALLAAAAKAANPASTVLPIAAGAALEPAAQPLLQELAAQLEKLGSALVQVRGRPERVLPQLCRKFEIDTVYFNRSVLPQRVAVEKRVESALADAGVGVKAFWGNVLVAPTDTEMRKMPSVRDVAKDRRENVGKVEGMPERMPSLPVGVQRQSCVQGKVSGGTSEALRVLRGMKKERELLWMDRKPDLVVLLKLYLDYGALSPRMVAKRSNAVLGKVGGRTFSEMVWRDYVAIAAHRAVGVRTNVTCVV